MNYWLIASIALVLLGVFFRQLESDYICFEQEWGGIGYLTLLPGIAGITVWALA